MTIFSYIVDLALAAVAVAMLLKGHYGATRQLALAPLMIAILDASFVGVISYSATPVLSILLTMLQLVVLCGSTTVLYQDRVRTRNKQARRRRRHDILRTQAAFEQAREQKTTRTVSICA